MLEVQMKCENCEEKHDGKYGSGRFCSSKCARSFSTQTKRKEINEKVSKALLGRKTGISAPTKGKKIPGHGEKIRESCRKRRILHIATLKFEQLNKPEQREKMLEEQNYGCCECGIKEEWNGKPLKFERDHISGDKSDNSRENLRLICPNCHQQTPTYKGRNNTQATRVTDEQVITSLLASKSGYESLKRLGMNMHGKNYEKLRRIIKQHNVEIDYIV